MITSSTQKNLSRQQEVLGEIENILQVLRQQIGRRIDDHEASLMFEAQLRSALEQENP